MTVQEDVEVLVDETWRPAKELGIWAEGWMHVFDADGERIGNVAGLFALGQPVDGQDDSSRKRFDIDGEPVQVEGFDELVKIMGMRWTERKVTDTMQVVSKAQGTPRLVVQQLDENGDPYGGRVIVDSKLKAWKLDEDGAPHGGQSAGQRSGAATRRAGGRLARPAVQEEDGGQARRQPSCACKRNRVPETQAGPCKALPATLTPPIRT